MKNKIIIGLLSLGMLSVASIDAAKADVKDFAFNISGMTSANTPISVKQYTGSEKGGCGRKDTYVINTAKTGLKFRLRNQMYDAATKTKRSTLKLGDGNQRICGSNYASKNKKHI